MRKRLLSILLIIAVVSTTLAGAIIPASAETGYDRGYAGGRWGDGVIYAHGLDLSTWQDGNVDFNAVKNAGYSYVILRAGYSGSKDDCFEKFYSAARSAGLDIGAYFYSYATTSSGALSDAQNTLDFIAGKKFEYPVYFDFEDSCQSNLADSTDISICLTFMDKLASAGYLTGLYSGKYFLTQSQVNTICAKYEYWMPHYYDNTYTSYHNEYSTIMGMYQYTAEKYVSGWGPYDANVCYKDYPTIVKKYGFNGYTADGPSAGAVANLGDSFYATLHNTAYDKYLSLDTVDLNNPIAFGRNTSNTSQNWKFERNSDDGSYKITNMRNNLVLTVKDGSSVAGADVITAAADGTKSQRWYLVEVNGGYVIQCKASTSNALDIDTGGKTGVGNWAAHCGENQIFEVDKIATSSAGYPENIGERFYARLHNTEYDRYLSLDYETIGPDNPIAFAKDDSNVSQTWLFERNGEDNTYIITNSRNSKVLAVEGGSSVAGADVITEARTDADNQRWYLVAEGNGYVLQCKTSTTNALDIDTGGKTGVGNWAAHCGVNQIFEVEFLNGGYVVKHYTQNIDGKASLKDTENYTLADTVTVGVSAFGEVTPALNSYTNRVAPAAVTITPAADGSTIVEYYYRLMFGDVNTDETVDANDLVSLKQRLVNNGTADSELAERLSDVNGDSKVSLNDVLRLKLYIADTTIIVGD